MRRACPNAEQITTARDQALLGRAIQDRFPQYYRYFSTTRLHLSRPAPSATTTGCSATSKAWTASRPAIPARPASIWSPRCAAATAIRRRGAGRPQRRLARRAHARADRREPRQGRDQTHRRRDHRTQPGATALRSGGSRDGSGQRCRHGRRTSARRPAPDPLDRARQAVADGGSGRSLAPAADQTRTEQVRAASQARTRPARPAASSRPNRLAAIPGSAEPMKPVKVKTVQVKAGPMKLASAGPSRPGAPGYPCHRGASFEVAETSSCRGGRRGPRRPTGPKPKRWAKMPPQPANHGTGQGILGVLPASEPDAGSRAGEPVAGLGLCRSGVARPAAGLATAGLQQQALQQQAVQQQATQQNGAIKPAAPAVVRTGWIIQVGALESESEAKQRIDLARNKASSLLSKADPFTEPVVSKAERTLSPRPFRRPRARTGRSGLQNIQARPIFPALPFATDPSSSFDAREKPAPSRAGFVFPNHSCRRNSHGSDQSIRRKLLVKKLRLGLRHERSSHAGQRQAIRGCTQRTTRKQLSVCRVG